MDLPSSLKIDIDSYSTAGIKEHNEDAAAFYVPEDTHVLNTKGMCAVVADGVSTAEAGREASQTAVTQFIEDYLKTPDTWSVSHAGEKIISSINLKLYRQSHAYKVEGKGYLCTFSAVVIKSRTAHVFHIGDSRIYLLRNGELKQLTHDHTLSVRKGHEFLSRAVGMDNQLHIDYSKVPVEQGDVLLLSSDGVHGFLEAEQISAILSADQPCSEITNTLAGKALDGGSDDNISAIVLRIEQLSGENIDDFNERLTRLPFPPPLEPGLSVDGYEVISEIYASARSQLYLVRDKETRQKMVMKTPSINYEEDNHYIDRFIQEEWIGKRIDSTYVVKVIDVNRDKNFLYYVLEWVQGIPLNEWIEKNPHPDPTLAINIVEQIAAGLAAFHQNDTTHQDLRPGNILIDNNNKIKIVDFGSVFVAGVAEIFIPIMHEGALGTASYADPQYLLGHNSGVQGDLYSLATIAYELFTGKLPYGTAVEDCKSKMDYDRLRYKPASKYNPVIPVWFDRALEKGVKFSLEERYSRIRDLIQDLKNPNPDFLRDDPKVEYTQSPLLFWQVMSVVWIVTLLAMVVLFSAGGE